MTAAFFSYWNREAFVAGVSEKEVNGFNMNGPRRKYFIFLFSFGVLFFQTGCAGTKALNQKQDYQRTTHYLRDAEYKMALASYPKKEQKGFITLTELSWLRLLNGESSSFQEIAQMGDQLPEKETVFISQEASHFFYQRTDEGYFPAEHEVIVFHLIAAMSFLQQKNKEAAFVEAKRAAFYLQSDYVSHTGAFDDPLLRVWLASIWVALDQWNAAQVDLRRAAELSTQYEWAAKLARKNSAPRRWLLVFQGAGPDIEWDPTGFQQVWTGKGSLRFRWPESADIQMTVNQNPVNGYRATDTGEIYERHQERNAQIREILETSDYMLKSSSLHVSGGAAKGAAKITNATFKVVGFAIGAAIVAGTLYVAAQGNGGGTGELVAFGVGLGVGSFQTMSDTGSKIDSKVTTSVNKSLDEALDVSKTYRFVRFIPHRLLMVAGDKLEGDALVTVPTRGTKVSPFLTQKTASGSVEFFFQPQ